MSRQRILVFLLSLLMSSFLIVCSLPYFSINHLKKDFFQYIIYFWPFYAPALLVLVSFRYYVKTDFFTSLIFLLAVYIIFYSFIHFSVVQVNEFRRYAVFGFLTLAVYNMIANLYFNRKLTKEYQVNKTALFFKSLLASGLVVLFVTSFYKNKNKDYGVYRNINHPDEYLVLFKENRYAHYKKSSTDYYKINIDSFSLSRNKIMLSNWKSFNFEFQMKNYPNGLLTEARIEGNKINFWTALGGVDNFIKTKEKLPAIRELQHSRNDQVP